MLVCNGCKEICNDNICIYIGDFILCNNCYNYHNNKLIPIIYDNNDNIIYLKSLQYNLNLINEANLLINFSKKKII